MDKLETFMVKEALDVKPERTMMRKMNSVSTKITLMDHQLKRAWSQGKDTLMSPSSRSTTHPMFRSLLTRSSNSPSNSKTITHSTSDCQRSLFLESQDDRSSPTHNGTMSSSTAMSTLIRSSQAIMPSSPNTKTHKPLATSTSALTLGEATANLQKRFTFTENG